MSIINKLLQGIKSQNSRWALSKAITLLESKKQSDYLDACQLLFQLHQNQEKNQRKTMRIGICGPPGCGKSTTIDQLGLQVLKDSLKLAVLCVDPSSQFTGGSLLGDKTRMDSLSLQDNTFIRPSPSKCRLGGVGPATADSIFLCEQAGYDVTIVESVGIGQSETFIDQIVDCVLLVLHPGAGDLLQASKRGIMEAADVIAINKADGELEEKANLLALQIEHLAITPKYPN